MGVNNPHTHCFENGAGWLIGVQAVGEWTFSLDGNELRKSKTNFVSRLAGGQELTNAGRISEVGFGASGN